MLGAVAVPGAPVRTVMPVPLPVPLNEISLPVMLAGSSGMPGAPV